MRLRPSGTSPFLDAQGSRTSGSPEDLDGVESAVGAQVEDGPGQNGILDRLGPPHRGRVSVGEKRWQMGVVVVLRGATPLAAHDDAGLDLLGVWMPDADGIVGARAVPVVLIGKRAVGKAVEPEAAATEALGPHVVASRAVPDRSRRAQTGKIEGAGRGCRQVDSRGRKERDRSEKQDPLRFHDGFSNAGTLHGVPFSRCLIFSEISATFTRQSLRIRLASDLRNLQRLFAKPRKTDDSDFAGHARSLVGS